MYIITTAGAEACIGLAIISIYYSGAKELSLNTLTLLKL
jgi:NADH:ubiquinone oxidoreductase subunit K